MIVALGTIVLQAVAAQAQDALPADLPPADLIAELLASGTHAEEALSEWQALRESMGLDDQTPWCLGEDAPLVRVGALRTLAADELLPLERDFATRATTAFALPARMAMACDDALAAAQAGDLRPAARFIASQAGSSASLLPPECFDDSATALRDLEALLGWERALSYERAFGADETVEAPPDGASSPVREVVLRSVAARMPDEPSWTTREHRTGACSSDIGADWESMARAPLSDMAPYRFVLEWALATAPPGDRTLLRMATYRYLASDVRTLELLAEHVGDDPDTAAVIVRALFAGVRQEFGAMREQAAQLEASDLRLARWTRAESLRHSESFDDAFAIASALSSADAYYVPALFTQAAVQIALDQPDEALRDLLHLERIVDGDPIYAMWVERLATRLR